MQITKDVYYLSGSTGILAKDMGKAILCQFPEVEFKEELIPFIRTETEARKALEQILAQSERPLVLSTLLSKELNAFFNVPGINFIHIMDHFLIKVEDFLETGALWTSGASRNPNEESIVRRVEAIHYSISHDDGNSVRDYDEADVILLGVSRSGKTPVSVFLATQMGIKTANYPLVKEDLDSCRLPTHIVKNRKKVIGLSVSPKLLHQYRENRYADSNYASLSTCNDETSKANMLYMDYQIPIIMGNGKSIEETAIQITHELNFSCGLKKYKEFGF